MVPKTGKLGRELRGALKEAVFFISLALRALKFWRKDPPVLNVVDLARFADSRAKFATQTTLFGYIKTRAGTRYTTLFADEKYALSINMAKWEIYLAALSDISIYVSAVVGGRSGGNIDEISALAIHIFNATLDGEEIPKERAQGFDDVRGPFSARVRTTPWNEYAVGENAFNKSLSALVEWAPIADELKMLDEEIVKNSMRFKWKKVRDDFDQLLNAESVMADWRSDGPSHQKIVAPDAVAAEK
ncbi:MAG: hypothetical protein KAR80_04850 [Rhodospirillaceae bacterium]|nr:hypothetical protein [Rhodospirillaceae bacterium]